MNGRRTRRFDGRLGRVLIVIGLLLGLVPMSVIQAGHTNDPATVTISWDTMVEAGWTWLDDDGFHVRNRLVQLTYSGDIEGTIEATIGMDWAGPCSDGGTICEGALSMSVASEGISRSWWIQGGAVLSEGGNLGRAIVIGRWANADTFFYLTEVVEAGETSVTYAGERFTMSKPVGGISQINNSCFGKPGVPSASSIRGAYEDWGAKINNDFMAFLWTGITTREGSNGVIIIDGTNKYQNGDLRAVLANDFHPFVDGRGYAGFHGYGYKIYLGGTGDYANTIGFARYKITILFPDQGPEVACSSWAYSHGQVTLN